MKSWRDDAACAEAVRRGEADMQWWFPQFPANAALLRRAKAICAACPVAEPCRAEAEERGEVGIWGGRTFTRPGHSTERTCPECGTLFAAPRLGGRPRETCSDECARERHRKQKAALHAALGGDVGKFIGSGHGTITRYRRGCRCQACRRAAREHRRRFRLQRQGAA